MTILSACHSGRGNHEQKQAVVFVSEIKTTELFDTLSFPARVSAKINTTVLSESDGIVVKLFTALGRSVRTQEKLLVLSHTDPIYQYAPVQIAAPIPGVISTVDVSVGTHVVQGQKLLSIMDPSQVRVHLELPAQDLDEVNKGSRGEFHVMNHDAQIPVIVDGMSPFVDPATGTASVEMSLMPHAEKNSDKTAAPVPANGAPPTSALPPRLSAGQQGQVTFKTASHLGISIPASAIFYKGNDPYVSVVEEDRIKQIQITLGKKQRGFVEVLKGLTSGMKLVERTSRFVADGEAVKIESAPTP